MSDQAAILGAVIATFFTLDQASGPWAWTDAIVGAAAGLILLGFAHLPDRPWTLRGLAQAAAIAGVGSLCLFLIASPIAQQFAPPCPADALRCDPGDPVSNGFLPYAIGVGFIVLIALFVVANRLPSPQRAARAVNRLLQHATATQPPQEQP